MLDELKRNRASLVKNMQMKLKQIRQFLNLTGQELGEIIGVTRQTVNNIEKYKTNLSVTQYIAIAAYLDHEIKNYPEKLEVIKVIMASKQSSSTDESETGIENVKNIYEDSFLDSWFLLFPEADDRVERRIRKEAYIDSADTLEDLAHYYKVFVLDDVFGNDGIVAFINNIKPSLQENDNRIIVPYWCVNQILKELDCNDAEKSGMAKKTLAYLKQLTAEDVVEIRGNRDDLNAELGDLLEEILLRFSGFHRLLIITQDKKIAERLYEKGARFILIACFDRNGGLRLYHDSDFKVSDESDKIEEEKKEEKENFLNNIKGWDSI